MSFLVYAHICAQSIQFATDFLSFLEGRNQMMSKNTVYFVEKLEKMLTQNVWPGCLFIYKILLGNPQWGPDMFPQ